MTEADNTSPVQHFATAAAWAMDAGFDGMALHAANGYRIRAEPGPGRFITSRKDALLPGFAALQSSRPAAFDNDAEG